MTSKLQTPDSVDGGNVIVMTRAIVGGPAAAVPTAIPATTRATRTTLGMRHLLLIVRLRWGTSSGWTSGSCVIVWLLSPSPPGAAGRLSPSRLRVHAGYTPGT